MTHTTAQPERRPRHKPGWVKPLRALFGFGVLVLLFCLIPIGHVFDALRGTQPGPVALAIGLVFLMQWIIADRLRRLCDAYELGWSTWQVFQINLATRFYSLLPGGNFTGIAVRFYKLTRDHGHYAGTAVALFYDRVAATVTMCGVGAVFWLLESPGDSWLTLAAILAGMLVMVGGSLVFFARSPGPLIRWLRRTLGRLGGVKLRTIRQAVRQSRELPRKQTALVYLLSTASHLMGILTWWLLCQALDIDVSLVTIGWVRSAVILATMIPLSVMGLGLREGAVVLLLTGYGVGQDTALAYSVLILCITHLLIVFAGGMIEALRYLRSH